MSTALRPQPGGRDKGWGVHEYYAQHIVRRTIEGRINLRNEDTKWLFRWLTPQSIPSQIETCGYGTQVIVS